MAITQCVECDKEIDVEPRRVGLRVICDYCGAEMEVVSSDPLELDLVAESTATAWDESLDDASLDDDEELEDLDELDELDDDDDEFDDDFDDLDDDDDFDDDDFDYDDDDFDDDDDLDEFDDDDFDDNDRW